MHSFEPTRRRTVAAFVVPTPGKSRDRLTVGGLEVSRVWLLRWLGDPSEGRRILGGGPRHDDVDPIKRTCGVRLNSPRAIRRSSKVTVEGHAPASDFRRLLAERPAIKGPCCPGHAERCAGQWRGRVALRRSPSAGGRHVGLRSGIEDAVCRDALIPAPPDHERR